MWINKSIVFPLMGISLFLQIWFNSEFSPLFYFSKSTFLFVRLSKFGQYLYLPFHWVFLSWDIEIDRREWAHRGTWYSIYTIAFACSLLFLSTSSAGKFLSILALLCSKFQTPTPPTLSIFLHTLMELKNINCYFNRLIISNSKKQCRFAVPMFSFSYFIFHFYVSVWWSIILLIFIILYYIILYYSSVLLVFM